MTVPFKHDLVEYAFLTNTLGETNKTLTELSADDKAAAADLAPLIHEESSLVVRRLSDNAYGLLIETGEVGHADQDLPDDEESLAFVEGMTINGVVQDGTSLPSLADVVTELQCQAEPIKATYPDLDVAVAVGDDTFDRKVVVRAFIPAGSPLMDERVAISEAMLQIYHRLREPAVSAPKPF